MTTDLLWYIDANILPAAFALLPGRMTSVEARALLLAVGLQESAFTHRRQVGGPARGFWQFEQDGAVKGVLTHGSTRPVIVPICDLLRYAPDAPTCYAAIEHHDVLAACFARLLLWTDPRALPGRHHVDLGWAIYLAQWRPGKPHAATWAEHFTTAWHTVEAT